MSASIKEEDRCWSKMLASSYTHYGAKSGQTPATLILGAYVTPLQESVETMSKNTLKAESFFVTTNGAPLKANAFQYAFQKIRGCINPGSSEYEHVRLYDFRYPNLNSKRKIIRRVVLPQN